MNEGLVKLDQGLGGVKPALALAQGPIMTLWVSGRISLVQHVRTHGLFITQLKSTSPRQYVCRRCDVILTGGTL
jgi:hypothetical protein